MADDQFAEEIAAFQPAKGLGRLFEAEHLVHHRPQPVGLDGPQHLFEVMAVSDVHRGERDGTVDELLRLDPRAMPACCSPPLLARARSLTRLSVAAVLQIHLPAPDNALILRSMKALVTGAARGLGLGLSTILAQRGYEVFGACRSCTPELEALGVRIIPGVDVSTKDALPGLRKGVGDATLDLLICNAGQNGAFRSASSDLADFDLDMAAYEYQTNALGPVRTVVALLPNLREGSKIVLITTGAGVTGKNPPSPGQWGYRMSKMALHTMAYQLATELRPRGIAVRLISPGAVNTDLMKRLYAAGRIAQNPETLPSPVVAAERLWPRIAELSIDATGTWVNFDGQVLG